MQILKSLPGHVYDFPGPDVGHFRFTAGEKAIRSERSKNRLCRHAKGLDV